MTTQPIFLFFFLFFSSCQLLQYFRPVFSLSLLTVVVTHVNHCAPPPPHPHHDGPCLHCHREKTLALPCLTGWHRTTAVHLHIARICRPEQYTADSLDKAHADSTAHKKKKKDVPKPSYLSSQGAPNPSTTYCAIVHEHKFTSNAQVDYPLNTGLQPRRDS